MAPRNREGARQTSTAPNLVPVFVTIAVVVVAAMAVAVMSDKEDQPTQAAPQEEATDSEKQAAFAEAFSDLDTSSKGSRADRVKAENRAPATLLEAPEFLQGKALATEAKELYSAALTAEKAGDDDTYREKAIAARDKFNEAMEVTADWEIGLGEMYSSDDRTMLKIRKEIDTWQKQMNKIRKVH